MLIVGCESVSVESCINSNNIKGAVRTTKRIIASGADVNAALTTRGVAPLHIAAGTEDIEFAQLLISKGADVNAKIDNGETPLNFATCSSGHSGSTKMVELLLKHGADPNSNSKLQSPLMGACLYSNYEVVEYLVENGADVNLADECKATALLYASDVKTIKYLISKGADVKAKNRDGRTVLMHVFCCEKINNMEKTELIFLLMEKGVEINAVETYGFFSDQKSTALDEAVLKEQPKEIISLLRSKGAKTAAELSTEQKKNQ
jgi:ankyrin repeat protein